MRKLHVHVIGLITLAFLLSAEHSYAQTNASVSAELVAGKLSSTRTKVGDQVAMKLNEDLKADGQVLLKKGSKINGTVKNVKAAGKAAADAQAQSVIEVEWLLPEAQGSAGSNVSLVVTSVTQVSPLHQQRQEEEAALAGSAAQTSRGAVSAGGGLLGGAVGGVGSAVGGAVGATTGVAGSVGGIATSASGATAATLDAPSVAAAGSMRGALGVASDAQLFSTGSGHIVTAGGSNQSLSLFSQMSNDTILTSNGNFEISSGAKMQVAAARR